MSRTSLAAPGGGKPWASALWCALVIACLACAGELRDPKPTRLDGASTGGDAKLPVTDSSQSGKACPCSAPYKCVDKVCRLECKSGKCNTAGGCPKGQACLKSTAGVPVCVPAIGLGKQCSDSINCAGGLLCLSFSPQNPNGNCYSVCDVSAGGPCPGSATCYLNTKSSCGYCYP